MKLKTNLRKAHEENANKTEVRCNNSNTKQKKAKDKNQKGQEEYFILV